MKIRLLSFLALAGLLFSSCAVEENPTGDVGSINAVMENDQTRTSVTDEGSFTWSAGDQVWLHTTNGGVVGTLSSGAGTASASFTYGAFFGDMTGKAVYPYNSGHAVSGNELSVVLPASYDLGSNLSNTNAAMYGVNVGGTIRFNHLAGVMRFVFKNVPAGTDKFQITLDRKINGTFTADLSQDYPVISTVETSVASEKTITFNFDALTKTSDISLYVPLPTGTYSSLALDLYAGSKSVWTYSNTVTNNIGRKTLKLMPSVSMGGSIDGELENSSTSGEIEGGVQKDAVTINIPPKDEIWYTSTTGGTISLDYYPYDLISNTYQNGVGKYKFAKDVLDIGNYFSDQRNPKEKLLLFTSITLPSNIKNIDSYFAMGYLWNASCLVMPENLETIGCDFIGGFGDNLSEKHIYFLSEKCPTYSYSYWGAFWNQSSTLYVHYPKGSDYSDIIQELEKWKDENRDYKYEMVETTYNLIYHN